jgi:hypothetical protein
MCLTCQPFVCKPLQLQIFGALHQTNLQHCVILLHADLQQIHCSLKMSIYKEVA